jgi:hypothetical protein
MSVIRDATEEYDPCRQRQRYEPHNRQLGLHTILIIIRKTKLARFDHMTIEKAHHSTVRKDKKAARYNDILLYSYYSCCLSLRCIARRQLWMESRLTQSLR